MGRLTHRSTVRGLLDVVRTAPLDAASLAGLLAEEDHLRVAGLSRLGDRERSLTAAAALRALVAARAAVTPTEVRLGRRCRTCGGTDHGRPVVLQPVTSLQLSVSHVRGCVLVAVFDSGPVGVDVEEVAAVGFDGFDEVVLSGAERRELARLPLGQRPHWRANRWTCKEALLKSTGHGLQLDPAALVLSARRVRAWPPEAAPVGARAHLVRLPADAGHVAWAAVLAAHPPRLRVHDAEVLPHWPPADLPPGRGGSAPPRPSR